MFLYVRTARYVFLSIMLTRNNDDDCNDNWFTKYQCRHLVFFFWRYHIGLQTLMQKKPGMIWTHKLRFRQENVANVFPLTTLHPKKMNLLGYGADTAVLSNNLLVEQSPNWIFPTMASVSLYNFTVTSREFFLHSSRSVLLVMRGIIFKYEWVSGNRTA